MENRYRRRDGFSLIEVIIAVAILAILSMPILLYFTNSAVHSANGKHEQSADMAAQSVIEEIDAMDNFSVLENKDNLTLSGEGWYTDDTYMKVAKEASAFSAGDEHADRVTTLYRPVTVNAQEYMAKVTIDYDAYMTSSSVAATYNNYKVPQLQEMHSDGSAVFADKANVAVTPDPSVDPDPDPDTPEQSSFIENGVREIYRQIVAIGGDAELPTLAAVRSGCERNFQIDITKGETENPGTPEENVLSYDIKGSYILSYPGTIPVTVPLGTERISADKFSNIYMPFYPMNGEPKTGQPTGVKAIINMPASLKNELLAGNRKLGISFIWQRGDVVIPDTYTIAPEIYDEGGLAGGALANLSFYTNAPLKIGLGSDLLYSEKQKRIASVTVEISDRDDFDTNGPDAARILATSTTTKAI